MKSYLYVGYEYKGQYYDHNKCQREISRQLWSHYLETNKFISPLLNNNDNIWMILYYFSGGIDSFTSFASHWMYMKAYAMGLSNVWLSKWIDERESFTDFTASFWDGVSGK